MSGANFSVVHEPLKETLDAGAESFLQDMVETEHFSGVVMVAQGGQILHRRAYNPRSDDYKIHAGSRLHVGSIGKQFTAAAIMQQVEAGAVQFDGGINDFLPLTHRAEIWEGINVEHLLAHTSGIPDYALTRDYYDVVDGWALGATIEGMIAEAKAQPLLFDPGTQFRYCNLGYTLLGEIIEVATGVRYADYIKAALLDPLGMENSQVHDENYVRLPGDAVGLQWDAKRSCHIRNETASLPVTPADGGLITTLDDFLRWAAVYKSLSHPKLSKPSLERMLAQAAPTETYAWPERNMRGRGFYGLGLMRSGDLIMHEGSIVGFRSFFIYGCDNDLLISVFSNNTYNDVFRIASGLFSLHVPSASQADQAGGAVKSEWPQMPA